MKRVIPIFLLSALLLTGCNGRNGDSSETNTTASAVTTVSEDTSASTETSAAASTTAETTATKETTTAAGQTSANNTKPPETEGKNEMNEEYTTPEIDVTEFKDEDVITTSSDVKINDDGSIELPIIPIR